MNALDLKTEALCWLRFRARMLYVATEVAYADVLACDEKRSIEIEVKTTFADLRADFQKPKHRQYGKPQPEVPLPHVHPNPLEPNQFYFLVPCDLEERAQKHLEELGSFAGLMVAKPNPYGKPELTILRTAKKLHARPPCDAMKRQLLMRMGSEICRARMAQAKFFREQATNFAGGQHLLSEALIARLGERIDLPSPTAEETKS